MNLGSNFLWGAATSAHQVDGNLHNQRTVWEQSEERKRYILDHGRSYDDFEKYFVSGSGCEHWDRWEADVILMKKLNLTIYRFSLEWSKIMPSCDDFDDAVLARYATMLDILHANNIKPMITLFHFTMPVWFAQMGGFVSSSNLSYAYNYVDKVVNVLGDRIPYWALINEIEPYALNSYLVGMWPPQTRSLYTYYCVRKNLIRFYKHSYHIIHKTCHNTRVGLAKNNVYFAYDESPRYHRPFLRLMDYYRNHSILRSLKGSMDFIGLNCYFHCDINNHFFAQPGEYASDLKWKFRPDILLPVLQSLKSYGIPIIVTESGIADEYDVLRGTWIVESLKCVEKAIQEGIDVQGYMYWTLFDNFEFHDGYFGKFGLIAINRHTQERTIKKSAYFFADIINHGGLTDDVIEKHRDILTLPSLPYTPPLSKTVTDCIVGPIKKFCSWLCLCIYVLSLY